MRKLKLILSSLIFPLLVLMLFTMSICVETPQKDLIIEKNVVINDLPKDSITFETFTSQPTIENVLLYLRLFEVQHVEIVLAQSILETKYYKCTECSLDSNNIFGFQADQGYFSYDNWILSVADYKDWQDRLYDGSMNYYYFLEEVGYAEDTEYTNKLRYIITQIQKYL